MLKKIDKENVAFYALIFLVSIVFLHSIVSATKTMNNLHHINDVTFVSQNLKESLFKHAQLHLWTPYYYSGQPLYAQPEYYFLDFNFLYIVLFRNIYLAMNLATITYFFLAGIGMYFLFLGFSDNKKGAFIAAIVYMLNGYMHTFVIRGNLNVLAGYALIPFAFLFFAKSLQSNLIRNSIFSGFFIALQIFAGGTLLIPYEIILFLTYGLFYLFGKNLFSRALKIIFAGVIIALVSFGMSAIKLLPGLEFIKLSNRGSGIPYQEYLGEPIELSNIAYIFITNLFSTGISASIGIMGFALLLFGLHQYRKRLIIFSAALIIISLLMATKGFVSDFLFKVPVFNQLRHIERAIFLISFAAPVLAGLGLPSFVEYVQKFVKFKKNIIFSVVIIFILAELLFLQDLPKSIEVIKPDEIEINDYISKDKERFRTINLALSTLVGATGYNYLAQLGISEIKGGSGIWFNDYLIYLSIAQQTNPAKFWGLLNNKYVISNKELSIDGLKFIRKFNECAKCPIGEVYGPYLYENLEFMPRAYLVDNAILIAGTQQDAERLIYPFMLENSFNPKKAVLINGKPSLDEYNLEELEKYGAIALTQSIGNNAAGTLRAYFDNGGLLLPSVFEGKSSVTPEDIQNLFNGFNGGFEEIEILEYSNNRVVYNTKGKKGFLVLSERFSNFPGWIAIGNDKKEIFRANGIITAVYIEKDDKITLEYKPKTFKNGLWITAITSILLIIYFIYIRMMPGGKNKA